MKVLIEGFEKPKNVDIARLLWWLSLYNKWLNKGEYYENN